MDFKVGAEEISIVEKEQKNRKNGWKHHKKQQVPKLCTLKIAKVKDYIEKRAPQAPCQNGSSLGNLFLGIGLIALSNSGTWSLQQRQKEAYLLLQIVAGLSIIHMGMVSCTYRMKQLWGQLRFHSDFRRPDRVTLREKCVKLWMWSWKATEPSEV